MDEREIKGAAANATAAYTTTLLEVARDALQEGAAAVAAVPNITATQIAQDALLSRIKKCEELSREVETWINHVKFNASRGRRFIRNKVNTGAKAFTALERSVSEVYKLHDRWKEVNTVSEKELEELPEEAPNYNLAIDRLTQLITGWEKCLSKARSCFHGYRKQDALDAA